jgi:hypothetical protein
MEQTDTFTSSLTEISIVKDDIDFKIYPFELSSLSPLESLTINENINSTVLGGNLFIKDVYNWSEFLNIHGFDKLKVKVSQKTPSEESNFNLKIRVFVFNIIFFTFGYYKNCYFLSF